MWQDAGVVAIVAGAVYYLGRKFFGRGPRTPSASSSFVPLSSLKKKR
ncbi:MAG: hypothetical protein R2712_13055 [Vicinamibacterales bacterium]